jgi:hypothetical protein
LSQTTARLEGVSSRGRCAAGSLKAPTTRIRQWPEAQSSRTKRIGNHIIFEEKVSGSMSGGLFKRLGESFYRVGVLPWVHQSGDACSSENFSATLGCARVQSMENAPPPAIRRTVGLPSPEWVHVNRLQNRLAFTVNIKCGRHSSGLTDFMKIFFPPFPASSKLAMINLPVMSASKLWCRRTFSSMEASYWRKR